MDQNWFALILFFLLIAATGGGILALSALIGRRSQPPERRLPYECGLNPATPLAGRISIKFFLVAMLFIIFDVEIVLLFPWAIAFREAMAAGSGEVAVIEIAVFIALLGLALLFAFRSKALEWER